MISKSLFENCENLPSEMSACLSRPWVDLGQVEARRPELRAICKECMKQHPLYSSFDHDVRGSIVWMNAYFFLTENNTDVTVYFGTCEKCGTPHWAQSEERPVEDKPSC